MSTAVLISIKPKWVGLIANGDKTIEIRKTRPKLETPFKCYIYETKGDTDVPVIYDDGSMDFHGRGMVVGEFVCDGIKRYPFINQTLLKEDAWYPVDADIHDMCLSYAEIYKYGGGKDLYGWHISDLVIYDKPKDLTDFFYPPEEYCEKGLCAKCPKDQMPTPDGDYEFDCEWNRPLKRPPQSWCYVEEIQ